MTTSQLLRSTALGLVALGFALSACSMKPAAYDQPFTVASDIALLSAEGVLPRNINLKAFDPHRKDFTCAFADARLPKVQAGQEQQAQSLFEQGLALTSLALWPNERNYVQAVKLWQQAADLGHWKAAMMLVNTYRSGAGQNSEKGQFYVPAEQPEQVLKRMEALMKQNVPDAFYEMGGAYESGYGVPRDVSRAWALWELAADMGSSRAQVHVANALNYGEGAQALKGAGAWANESIALQMFECAVEQGNGAAAFKLGMVLDLDAESGHALNGDKEAQFARARQILHNGVKWGSADAADYLFTAFDDGAPLVDGFIDKFRSRRYATLSDALFNNPDLRFPNLDKVLPLPPAKLPVWDGNKKSLIDAAKAVVPAPKSPQKTSAIEIPADAMRVPAYRSILTTHARWGQSQAPLPGYWLAQPRHGFEPNINWSPQQHIVASSLERARPQLFRAGQTMPVPESHLLDSPEYWMHIEWVHLGDGRALNKQADLTNWRVQAGQAVAPTETLSNPTECTIGQACPQTGTWVAKVPQDHPSANGFNRWDNQTYVRQGEAMPTPVGVSEAAGVSEADVTYTLVQIDPQPDSVGDTTDPTIALQEATRLRIRKELGIDPPDGEEPKA